jgi:hypothetical protein|tara:strand:- start:5263 stop:5532 length:270 start_codon:yes stop_codon:yes gene_type:complete
MQQQSFRFYDIDPEQLSFDFPVQQRSYVQTDLLTTIEGSYLPTGNAYLTVSNSDGGEAARIDDTGISLRMENKSWLKTKVANWLGVKYL